MKRAGSIPAWIFLILFFVLPLLALIPETVVDGKAVAGKVLTDRLFLAAVKNTIFLGISTSIASTIIGTAIAIEVARQPLRRRKWITALLGLPLAFSGLVIAYGFILAYGRAGFVTQILSLLGFDAAEVGQWIYSTLGVGIAYSYYLIPRVALALYPVFLNLDNHPRLAARTLGAGRIQAFWDTTVPEVWPSIVANACLIAALSMGTYGTALALSGTQVNIVPLLLYTKISGGSDTGFSEAAAISLFLVILCGLILSIGNFVTSRRERSAARVY